jgi:hypothetical protein
MVMMSGAATRRSATVPSTTWPTTNATSGNVDDMMLDKLTQFELDEYDVCLNELDECDECLDKLDIHMDFQTIFVDIQKEHDELFIADTLKGVAEKPELAYVLSEMVHRRSRRWAAGGRLHPLSGAPPPSPLLCDWWSAASGTT